MIHTDSIVCFIPIGNLCVVEVNQVLADRLVVPRALGWITVSLIGCGNLVSEVSLTSEVDTILWVVEPSENEVHRVVDSLNGLKKVPLNSMPHPVAQQIP